MQKLEVIELKEEYLNINKIINQENPKIRANSNDTPRTIHK